MNLTFCEILKRVLEKNGFGASTFSDPLLALENFRPRSYDLLLLDIKIPEMDGLRLYQEMKNIDSSVKVCFLTASEMYYEKFRKEEGFDRLNKDLFLRKPIETASLGISIQLQVIYQPNQKYTHAKACQ